MADDGAADADATVQSARTNFPELFEAPFVNPVDDGRPVDANTAVVDVRGKRELAVSTMPLRLPDADDGGKLEPTDLGLRQTGDGPFDSINAPAPVSAPEDASGSVRLTDLGVSVSPLADAASTAGRTAGDAVIYPDAAKDTDVVVSPTDAGFETSYLLRSSDSPTTLRYTVTDGVLAPSGKEPDSYRIDVDGQPKVFVPKPSAVDADGKPVDLTTHQDGNDLVMDVDPGADASFPIKVDPVADPWFWDNNPGSSPSKPSGQATDCPSVDNGLLWGWCFASSVGNLGGQSSRTDSNGLYIYRSAGGDIPGGSAARWQFQIHGDRPNAFVQSFRAGNLSMQANNSPGDIRLITGVWQQGGASSRPKYVTEYAPDASGNEQVIGNQYGKSEWQDHDPSRGNGNFYGWQTMLTGYDTGETAGQYGDVAYFMYYVAGGGQVYESHMSMGDATVYIGDNDAPSLSFTPPNQTLWHNWSSVPLQASAGDNGLGVRFMTVTNSDNSGVGALFNIGCDGTGDHPCPTSANGSYSLVPAEGQRSYIVRADDPLGATYGVSTPVSGHTTTSQFSLKTDRTAPTGPVVSGPLAAGGPVSTSAKTLTATATDALSGVGQVEFSLDKGTWTNPTASCATGADCPHTSNAFTYTLPSGTTANTQHTIDIRAVDSAGNTSGILKTITFTIDTIAPTTPTFTHTRAGAAFDPSQWTNATSGTVTTKMTSTDANGVASFKLTNFAGQTSTLAATSNAAQTTYSLDTTTFPHDGAYTASAVANDAVGNTSASGSWSVKIDRTAPTIAPTGALFANARSNGGTGYVKGADTATIAATDASSGVASLSVKVNGTVVATKTCATDACPVTLPALDTSKMHEGDNSIHVDAADRAGNTTSLDWVVTLDRTPPELSDDGLMALDGQTLGEDSYTLSASARDTDATTDGAGLDTIAVSLDGAAVSPAPTVSACGSDTTCEKSASWTWDATKAQNGTHTFTVTATDKEGNQSTDTAQVDLERPGDLDPVNITAAHLTLQGAASSQAGSSVASLGDINGDGFGDYAVSAPAAARSASASVNPNAADAGAVYVVLGRGDDATVNLATAGNAGGVYTIQGPGASSYCGVSVATAGDTDGDGVNDLLVGCPGYLHSSGSSGATRGTVYVVSGASLQHDVDLAQPGSAFWAITGPSDVVGANFLAGSPRPDGFGESLASAGVDGAAADQDVNGDGLADIVIGDSSTTEKNTATGNSDSRAGRVFVVYGKADHATVDATTMTDHNQGYVIVGVGANSFVGFSAAVVGDLDQDGLADIAVGAPGMGSGAGAVYLVNGASTAANVDLGKAGSAVKLSTGQAGDYLGSSVLGVGDSGQSGHDDVAMATASGAWVLRDTPTVDTTLSTADAYQVLGPKASTSLLSLNGATTPAATIAAAGDGNDDARTDLVVGFPWQGSSGPSAVAIAGPEVNRTIDVTGSLPGQRGSSLMLGNRTNGAGSAVAADQGYNTDNTGEFPTAMVGEPNANNNAGAAYVAGDTYPHSDQVNSQGSTRLRDKTNGSTAKQLAGCYRNSSSAYSFDVGPSVTYGYRVNTTPATATDPNGTSDYNRPSTTDRAIATLPPCRETVHHKADRVPLGYSKLSAVDFDVLSPLTPPDAAGNLDIPVEDSFGRTFATIRQHVVTDANGKRMADGVGILDASRNAIETYAPTQYQLSIQGYACFVGDATDKYGARFNSATMLMAALSSRPGHGAPVGNKGVRGFISVDALSDADRRLLAKPGNHNTGCGHGDHLSPGAAMALKRADGLDGKLYQGQTTALRSCTDFAASTCGVDYDNFQPFSFKSELIAGQTTTGFSGKADGRAEAGIATAVIPVGTKAGEIDKIGYADPNVPCGMSPDTVWREYQVGGHGLTINGWLPEEHSGSALPTRKCPRDVAQRPPTP